MNAVGSPADVVREDHSGLIGGGSYPDSFTLRRTGRKAVRFQGRQLVEAAGSKDGRDIWHDLNIYSTVDQQIVVELITRRNLAEQQDIYCVEAFDDLTEAATWLQCYDATGHVPIPFSLGVIDTALPWAVMQAVQLRQIIDRICTDYRSLLTEVFMALDLTDPVEVSRATPEPALDKAGM